MPAKAKEINLLPKEPWETGVVGKFIHWTLTVGRYVVVFTELIVISAFLYRFSLDRQLTDLNEKIKQRRAIITNFGDLEEKFRTVQLQLEKIKTLDNQALTVDVILEDISQITPIDTVYESITVNAEAVVLQGKLLSEVGLATLLAKAQADKNFSGVTLENISSGTINTQEINFRMTLNLKK